MADITYFEDGDDLYLCFHNCKANAETLKNVLLAIGATAAAPAAVEPAKHADNTEEVQKVVEAKKEKEKEQMAEERKKTTAQQQTQERPHTIRTQHEAKKAMLELLNGKNPKEYATTGEKRKELWNVYKLFVYYGGKRNESTEKAIWPNSTQDQINKTVEEVRRARKERKQ